MLPEADAGGPSSSAYGNVFCSSSSSGAAGSVSAGASASGSPAAGSCACGRGGSGSRNRFLRSSPFSMSFRFTPSVANTGEQRYPFEMSLLNRIRWKIAITLDDPSSSTLARYISSMIIVVIAISIVNFAVGSVDTGPCRWDPAFKLGAGVFKCDGVRIESHDGTYWIEAACIFIFSAEYLIRVLCCGVTMPLWRFVISPLNMLDLVAILPWYVTRIIEAVMPGDSMDSIQNVLGVLRIVRLTRILRVFKASKSMKMMLVLGRTLQRSTSILSILLFSSICMMVLFGALIVVTEEGVYNPHLQQYVRDSGSISPFFSMGNAMYWCMTTMTTVGYGDYYPETPGGSVVGVMCMLMGVVILSLPITVISRTFTEEFEEQTRISKREAMLRGLRLTGTVTVDNKQKTLRSRVRARMGGGSFRWRPSLSCDEQPSSSGEPSLRAEVLSGASSSAVPDVDGASQGSVHSRQEGEWDGVQEVEDEVTVESARKSRADVKKTSRLAYRESGEALRTPGYVQCKWLVSDFANNTANEFQVHVRRGEADLLRMSRHVLIHSRIVSERRRQRFVEMIDEKSTDLTAEEAGLTAVTHTSPAATPGYRARAEAPSAPADEDRAYAEAAGLNREVPQTISRD
eukprot:CAMPEP_0174735366 /NCGR_PEP_ID=MMETSP1094-20130205/64845_1 /TAXON_ID=156173 /ORGANISM="Chrysochromulina brevifilum, Strain UTEX LB 985" /LENGTH=628 /DNA_ID=CAMNT_0015938323 /DNA_START=81 /DNA_END=1967 /DNA_ORIENTATION=-